MEFILRTAGSVRFQSALFAALAVLPFYSADAMSSDARIDELVEELSSPNEIVRIRAATTLGEKGESAARAGPALLKNLTDANRRVSGSAAEALVKIGPTVLPYVTELINREGPDRYAALRVVGSMGQMASAAVPVVIGAMDGGFKGVGIKIVMWEGSPMVVELTPNSIAGLSGIRESDVIERVNNNPVKSAVEVSSFVRNAPTDSISITVRHFDSAMRTYGQPETLVMRRERIDDHYSRLAAINALGQIGPAARPALKKLINVIEDNDVDASPSQRGNRMDLRRAALEAILKIDPPVRKDIPAFLRSVRESKGADRAIAIKKLGHLGQHSPEIIQVLVDAWSEMKEMDGKVAAESLVRIASSPMACRAIAAAVDTRQLAELIAEHRLPLTADTAHFLLPVFDQYDRQLLRKAAYLLGTLNPASDEVIDAMAKRLSSTAQGEFAEQVLAAFGPQARRAAPQIIDALADYGDSGERALRALGKDAEPAIVKALNEGDKRKRLRLIRFLEGSFDHPWSLLVSLAKHDPELDVRLAALTALGRAYPLSMEIGEILGSFVESETRQIRLAAIEALADRGAAGASGLRALKKRLEQGDPDTALLVSAIRKIEHAEFDAGTFAAPETMVQVSSPTQKDAVVIAGPSECMALSILFPRTGYRATTSGSSTVCLWDLRKKTVEAPVFGGGGQLLSQSMDSDQLKLLTNGAIRKVSVSTRRSTTSPIQARSSYLAAAARDADGIVVAALDARGTSFYWSRDGDMFQSVVQLSSQATALCLSPDGRDFIVGLRGGVVLFFETASWRTTKEFLIGHWQTLTSCAISPDGKFAVLGLSYGAAAIRKRNVWEFHGLLTRELSGVAWSGFSNDGSTLATVTRSGIARSWSMRDMKQTSSLATGGGYVVTGGVAPDGNVLATVDGSGTVRLWDLREGSLRYVLKSESR